MGGVTPLTHTFNEIYDLFPKLDCGLCGNPSCRTMARKVITGDAKVEGCVNLKRPEFQENLTHLRTVLAEGVEIGAKGVVVVEEAGITYVHPCISEAGKVMAEAKLASGPEGSVNLKFGFYDPIMLCWALEVSGLFNDFKCSTNLGVAKLNIDGKTVMVFKDGRVNVRAAKDKQDAIETIRLVSRSLWGAIICSCCGNVGIDCASGGCADCLSKICPVLGGGPPDPTGRERSESMSQTTAQTIFERVKALPTRLQFEAGVESLDTAMKTLQDLGESILLGKFQDKERKSLQNIQGLLEKANQRAVRVVVETPAIQDATVGLILAGVALDISRMTEGIKTLVKLGVPLTPKSCSLLRQALSIALDGYKAFRSADEGLGRAVLDNYQMFKNAWGGAFKESSEKEVLVAVEKLAVNGFYIARLLNKPLPT